MFKIIKSKFNQKFCLRLTYLVFSINAGTITSKALFVLIKSAIRNDLASNIRILGSCFFFSTKKTFAFSSAIYLQILHGMEKEQQQK